MGRIRTIKPDFFKHEELSGLPAETHLLAAGLLCLADDEGFFRANPTLVSAKVFPLRECSVSAHDMLNQLSQIGYLRLGTSEDGKRYGQVVKFSDHQRVNRPTPSKIKTLRITWDDSVSVHGELTEDSLPEGKGKEGKGSKEGNATKTVAPPPLIVPVIHLPLNDGTEHPITQEQVNEWVKLYPAVDVMQALRSMRGWATANRANRKTKSGIGKFIVAWLNRQQDKASSSTRNVDAVPTPKRRCELDGAGRATYEKFGVSV